MEKWIAWLRTCPQLEAVTADAVPSVPGGCGLIRQNISELWRREDLLGRRISRIREEFLLVRNGGGELWPEEFTQWVRQNPHIPALGQDGQVRVVGGRKEKAPSPGLTRYTLTLRGEYTQVKE